MSDSEFDIKYVANLARIALNPEEEERLGSQLGDILGYVKKLEELDVSDVEPMAHAVPLDNASAAPVAWGTQPGARRSGAVEEGCALDCHVR